MAVARQLHVTAGSVLKASIQSGPAAAGLRVTGLFRVKNPASPYWAMDLVSVSGFSGNAIPAVGQPGSLLIYGPAVVNPAHSTLSSPFRFCTASVTTESPANTCSTSSGVTP